MCLGIAAAELWHHHRLTSALDLQMLLDLLPSAGCRSRRRPAWPKAVLLSNALQHICASYAQQHIVNMCWRVAVMWCSYDLRNNMCIEWIMTTAYEDAANTWYNSTLSMSTMTTSSTLLCRNTSLAVAPSPPEHGLSVLEYAWSESTRSITAQPESHRCAWR